ncbi:AraC family transcriptional regulator [uncultured Thiohalocapsa sp.]|uniref:helix-turn-helix domain-containing protein n=1 Tax=uncultured Thiohalocapsa sp. TaxID=768990 RepID=UPI0025CEC884|nr:helix-turn-helix domain-containing protein [uncultured Thiohalocapsa sp.]
MHRSFAYGNGTPAALCALGCSSPGCSSPACSRPGSREALIYQCFPCGAGCPAIVSDVSFSICERLKADICTAGIPVQLIADRVGYRNAGDFTRAFRRHFGVTPRQYRRGRPESDQHNSVES